MKTPENLIHPFKPVFNKNSKILILGSMPSPVSRQVGFYFGHPQNRFWKVMSALFNEEIAPDTQSKIKFLKKHNIALWDVVESCSISGSSDASIKNVKINDFNLILNCTHIKAIFTLGNSATTLFRKNTNLTCIALPSTSPANCAITFDELLNKFKIILNYL